jgi:hypothetical protein
MPETSRPATRKDPPPLGEPVHLSRESLARAAARWRQLATTPFFRRLLGPAPAAPRVDRTRR